jgi:hypothetical protein
MMGGGAVYGMDGNGNVFVHRRGAAGGGPRQRPPTARGHGGGGNPNAIDNRMMQLVQLLPILVLVLFTLFSFSSLTGDERLYSLNPEAPFSVERRTASSSVVANLPYYVKEDFLRRVGGDRWAIARVERAVETELYTSLSRKCNEEAATRRGLETKARWSSGDTRAALERRIRSLPMPACDAFQKYFGQQVG